jgi:hypothetical protein
MNYKISEINIISLPLNNGHIGFCQFVLNDVLKFNNVAIHTKWDGTGIRLLYPKYNGLQVVYPISKALGDFITNEIEKVLIERYNVDEGVLKYGKTGISA